MRRIGVINIVFDEFGVWCLDVWLTAFVLSVVITSKLLSTAIITTSGTLLNSLRICLLAANCGLVVRALAYQGRRPGFNFKYHKFPCCLVSYSAQWLHLVFSLLKAKTKIDFLNYLGTFYLLIPQKNCMSSKRCLFHR